MFVRSHCDRKRYFTLRLLCTWRCSGISGWCSANLRKVGRWQPLPTNTTTGGRAVFSHWLSGESAVPGGTLNLVIFGVPKTVKSDKSCSKHVICTNPQKHRLSYKRASAFIWKFMFLSLCAITSILPAYTNQNLPVLLLWRKSDVLKPLVCYIMNTLKPKENYGCGTDGHMWGHRAS